MQVYNVGVIGCGRISSLLEQETHRGTPNTHAVVTTTVIEPVLSQQQIGTMNADRVLEANGMFRVCTRIGGKCWILRNWIS